MKNFEPILVPKEFKAIIKEKKGSKTYESYFKELMQVA